MWRLNQKAEQETGDCVREQQPFEEIVRNHQERVRNTCYRFVGTVEDADDIAQEVFLAVYKALPRFRADSEIATWIYRIAVNKSLDFVRRQRRGKRLARLISLVRLDHGEEQTLIDEKNPQHELEDIERRRVLWEAVNRLPENQRAVITLSKYEGFANKEIADILQLSLSAVEALQHRAKVKLRDNLREYYEKTV